MAKFLRYEDFVDPTRKDKYDSITIFDVDDTLVVTKSLIRVVDTDSGEKFELTPAQFNEFEKKSVIYFLNSSLNIGESNGYIDGVFNSYFLVAYNLTSGANFITFSSLNSTSISTKKSNKYERPEFS
jgi:hypothetical protein